MGEVIRAETLDAVWKEKYEEWTKRPSKKLPKWFGERPGKKAGDAPTPEGEEEGGEEAAPRRKKRKRKRRRRRRRRSKSNPRSAVCTSFTFQKQTRNTRIIKKNKNQNIEEIKLIK